MKQHRQEVQYLICFSFGCEKLWMPHDGQRREKTEGKSQFNQILWGGFYLNRSYAASSQITARKTFVSEKKFSNKSQLAISDSFAEKTYFLKAEDLFYRETSQERITFALNLPGAILLKQTSFVRACSVICRQKTLRTVQLIYKYFEK